MQVTSSQLRISAKALPIPTMNLESFPWQTASFLKPHYGFHLCITTYNRAETFETCKGSSQQQKPKPGEVWWTGFFLHSPAISFQCKLCRNSQEKEKSKSELCLFSLACCLFSFAWSSLTTSLSVSIAKPPVAVVSCSVRSPVHAQFTCAGFTKRSLHGDLSNRNASI